MGYIKEPKGVDFTIQSEPLTDEVRQEISEFISNYKKEIPIKKKKKPVVAKHKTPV